MTKGAQTTKRWKTLAVAAAVGVALTGFISGAGADDYPNRPIRLIVPFSPGGGGDATSTAFKEELGKVLGQPVVVEYRGGGSAMIGTDLLTRSKPDGYTLLMCNSTYVTNPILQKNITYKTPDDFTPIARVMTFPYILAVRSDLGIDNVGELVDYAKKNPGRLTTGTAGSGSGMALAARQLEKMAGIELMAVPFKGSGPVLAALAGGHVDMAFGNSSFEPFGQKGTKVLKIIASTGPTPIGDPPIPTIASQGIEGFSLLFWWGVFAPAGTPAPIVEKINSALKQVFTLPEVQKRIRDLEGEPYVTSSEEFDQFTRAELAKWTEILK